MPEGQESEQADDSLRVDATPRRRRSGLTIAEVEGETLVYELRTHHVHCLNPTTAFVWQQCDGERTVPAIAGALEEERGIPANSGAVWLALGQLGEARLLEDKAVRSGVTLSRRGLLRTVAAAGVAATALPTLKSITAPTAASAASLLPGGASCTLDSQCSSGECCSGRDCDVGICNCSGRNVCRKHCVSDGGGDTGICGSHLDCTSNICTVGQCAPNTGTGPCGCGTDCATHFHCLNSTCVPVR